MSEAAVKVDSIEVAFDNLSVLSELAKHSSIPPDYVRSFGDKRQEDINRRLAPGNIEAIRVQAEEILLKHLSEIGLGRLVTATTAMLHPEDFQTREEEIYVGARVLEGFLDHNSRGISVFDIEGDLIGSGEVKGYSPDQRMIRYLGAVANAENTRDAKHEPYFIEVGGDTVNMSESYVQNFAQRQTNLSTYPNERIVIGSVPAASEVDQPFYGRLNPIDPEMLIVAHNDGLKGVSRIVHRLRRDTGEEELKYTDSYLGKIQYEVARLNVERELEVQNRPDEYTLSFYNQLAVAVLASEVPTKSNTDTKTAYIGSYGEQEWYPSDRFKEVLSHHRLLDMKNGVTLSNLEELAVLITWEICRDPAFRGLTGGGHEVGYAHTIGRVTRELSKLQGFQKKNVRRLQKRILEEMQEFASD